MGGVVGGVEMYTHVHVAHMHARPYNYVRTKNEVSSLAMISEFRLACTDLYENGDGYIPFVLEANIDEHQSFHGPQWVLKERTKQLCVIESSPKSGHFKKGGRDG